MALIQTVNSYDLYHMACRMGRGEQFGYAGWNAIGDYLEQLSEDTGEDYEVDIIAICCEYSSADSIDEFWSEYYNCMDVSSEEWENQDDEERLETVRAFLEENTSIVVCEEDLIIWQAF